MGNPGEGFVKNTEVALQRRKAVNIGRRADLLGDPAHRHFFGKQLGVFGFGYIAIKSKLATLPENVSWGQLYGAAILCGVGFTMSLFIGSLAFEEGGILGTTRPDRLGIIAGSLLAGIVGFVVLKMATKRPED